MSQRRILIIVAVVVLAAAAVLVFKRKPPAPAPAHHAHVGVLGVAPAPPWKQSADHWMVGVPVILDASAFARQGAPEKRGSLMAASTDWAKPACPDETLYAIEKWAYHRFVPRDEPAQLGPNGQHFNVALELTRTFQSGGGEPCFIPAGGVSFVDGATSTEYHSLSAASLVTPPDGQLDVVTIRLPDAVRFGSLRFRSPSSGTLSEVRLDFRTQLATPVTGAKSFNAQD